MTARGTPGDKDAGVDVVRAVPAFKSIGAAATFLIVAVAGLAADLASKDAVFAALAEAPNRSSDPIIPGVLRFTLSENEGIAFGFPVPGPIVLAATAVAIAVVIVLFAASTRADRALHVGLGMLMGGSIGNACDRLATGRVRDFINVYAIRYPVFNIADILLVVGVGLILLHLFRHRKDTQA